MALTQHVIDLVKRPLAVAGRPAGAHRRYPARFVDGLATAQIAPGLPAGKAFRLFVQIVQGSFQRVKAVAKAGGVEGVSPGVGSGFSGGSGTRM